MSPLLTDATAVPANRKLKNPSDYRREQLTSASKRIELDTDFPRIIPSILKLAAVPFSLPKDYSKGLDLLCQQYGAGLSTVLLSAFKILLYRHTYQTNLTVGYTTVDNNSGIANTEIILPVFTQLNKTSSFIETLEQIKVAVKDAIDYKEETIEFLNEISFTKDSDSFFFHQVIFSFKNSDEPGFKKNEKFQGIHESYNDIQGVELRLELENSSEGIKGALKYNEALFNAETIARIVDHYQVLLNEILHDPAQRISHVAIMGQAELNKILFEWNDTKTNFPSDKCIHELFQEQVILYPNATAVVLHKGIKDSINIANRQLTFSELNKKANQVAHYLHKMGVGPEVLIGVFMNRSLEMVIAILGILKAGGAYLPLDPGNPKERLEYIFKDSGIALILSQHHLLKKLQSLEKKVICVDQEWNKISLCNADNLVSQANPENLAYVIYTSGSTGFPKGTLIIHKGVVNYLSWCIKAYHVDNGNGCPVNSSIGFDATVTSFFSPLLSGKQLLLLPEAGEVEALTEVLQQKNKFSLVKITPAHLEILSGFLTPNDLSEQTNAFIIGGEALTGKHLSFWQKNAPGTRLINEYGPTETVVGCCIYELPKGMPVSGNIPIGRPIANTQIYILDSHKQPVPIGAKGEIYIAGAGVARGYLNQRQLTTERFVANPFSKQPAEKMYKTGDIARYLPDGNIEFLGRADDQVKIRGYRIELGEVQHAMQQLPCVSRAVVIAIADTEEEGKRLKSYYIPDGDALLLKEKELSYQRVTSWKGLYETEYGQTEGAKNIDPEFNIIGWNDSFTGKAIPAGEMKEWLNDIVAVVLKEQPQQVLEIGCGTGLICYQLAGKVKKYTGCDLSVSSIKQIKERIGKKERNYGDIELFTAPAHEVKLPEGQVVDTILLNSMVQYFPSQGYMDEVMSNCMNMIGRQGRIIIGDVRDNRLLKVFRGRLKMQKTPDSVDMKVFRQGLEQDMMQEEELCFSPAYFYDLQTLYPQISHVDILWKKAVYTNELSLYRYTVILHIGLEKELIDPAWQSWEGTNDNTHFFSTNGQPLNMVAIKDVPNHRLRKEKFLHDALLQTTVKTVGELQLTAQQSDIEMQQIKTFLQLAETKGYSQKLFVHPDPFKMNVLLEKSSKGGFIQQPVYEKLSLQEEEKTNMPLFSDINIVLQKEIKKALLERLPAYMVPAAFIAIRHIPLTTNGKVDYAALPVANQQRQASQKPFVAARNDIELKLSRLFEKSLLLDKISVKDDLFALGINSLQAYRIFAQIKKITGIQLPLSILIQAPTIEQLAVYLKKEEADLPWSSIVPIQPKGSKPPLYLIHAGAGTVLFYRELSLHLGEDQPVYGLQPKGVDGKQRFHTTIEEMAEHYIHEIQMTNPEGPYLLGGYCFGAVVAFEMAQQLISKKYKVALLANFNGVSPTYVHQFKTATDVNNDEKNVDINPDANALPDFNWKMVKEMSNKKKFLYLSKKAKARSANLFTHHVTKRFYKLGFGMILLSMYMYKCYQSLGGINAPQILRKYYFLFVNESMVKAYRPKPYTGVLTIFRSPGIYNDPQLGWTDFVTGKIITCDIPGNHADRRQIMNEPFVQDTAKALEKYMADNTQLEHSI